MKIIDIPVVNDSLNYLPKYAHIKNGVTQDSGADVTFFAEKLNPEYWFDVDVMVNIPVSDSVKSCTISAYASSKGINYEINNYDAEFEEVLEVLRKGELDHIEIAPGGRILLPTGLHMAVPEGYEIQVRDRSGIALKKGLIITNGIGTIDACYRGDIGVILSNPTSLYVTINPNEMICQFVLAEIVQAIFHEVDSLDSTERGDDGYGSTDNKQ